MNVMLNLVPLKSGGGVQVGLDFVAQARRSRRHQWHVVVTAGTPLAQITARDNIHLCATVGQALPARTWFELSGCRRPLRSIRPAIVHTLFGPQWPGAAGVTSVVGCAYSNLCYPEINFWERLPPAQRAWRELVDHGRRRRLRQADAVIFETEDLAERAVHHLRLDPRRVHVVRPSASSLVGEHIQHQETAARCRTLPAGFRVLLLSVYNPNKNFELLPRIAQVLQRRGCNDTVFVITLPHGAPQLRALMELAAEFGVADRLYNIGPVPQAGCTELYRVCDAVILPSQLESFSNSIAESWAMSRPLLISDLPWAHSLCGRGARYFRYDDPTDAAARILELRAADAGERAQLVDAGFRQLASYPTAEQRFRQYLEILERYAER